jgi:1-acyl-sn-glycerol-3-phosphate acyltransferase
MEGYRLISIVIHQSAKIRAADQILIQINIHLHCPIIPYFRPLSCKGLNPLAMRQFIKPVWWLYCIYALLLFITGMFCVLPFVILFSLQDEKRGGDRIYKACRYWDSAWLTLVGIRHTNTFESTPDPGRQYVFVANHISYLDIPIILQAIRRNSFRILGKAEMTKFPIFGYIYSRAVVLVDRTTNISRSRSVRN